MMRYSECVYAEQYNEGYYSVKLAQCPYEASNLGAKCAWIAGYYDRWGFYL